MSLAESRWDQEEGGELDSHEEVKTLLRVQVRSRGGRWCWTLKLAQKRPKVGRWSWAWKLDFFCISRFSTAELWTLSLWLCSTQQLRQQLHSTLVAAQRWADTALTFLLFWQWSMAFLVFQVGTCFQAFTLSSPSLINNLISVDVKQNDSHSFSDDVALVEFAYLVCTCMPDDSYCRWLKPLLSCLCDVFQLPCVLINCSTYKQPKSHMKMVALKLPLPAEATCEEKTNTCTEWHYPMYHWRPQITQETMDIIIK